jgi:F-type H+-transporting ATPase subunit gamma
MASIKDLKKRITTVKNTQQTTRAMKMVSAAKLRRAQEAIQNHRPYAKRIGQLIQLLSKAVAGDISSPLMKRESVEGAKKGKVLLVVVSSDRGLCGGFNGNVIKGAQKWLLANGANYDSAALGFVGRKAHDIFKMRKVTMGPYYADLGGKVTFAKATKLADALVQLYTSGEYDEVKVIYNEFKNAVTQRVVVENFLPIDPTATTTIEGDAPAADAGTTENTDYLVKPSPGELLHLLMEKNFAIQAFRFMLESQASEHGARMSAMENATKNAGEMIRKLSLQYNKQRQANITKELLEIISGSESQKSSA